MRLDGRASEMCLRHALWKNDALGKTIVILTHNMPLALTRDARQVLVSFSLAVLCVQPLL